MEYFFNKEAVFTDETMQFVSPCSPTPGETTTFKIRVAAGTKCEIRLHINATAKSEGASATSQAYNHSDVYLLENMHNCTIFDYYTIEIPAPLVAIRYFYSIVWEGEIFYYNKQGLCNNLLEHYNFRLIPGLHAPDWAKGALMYHIFVDRFCNGDTTNDVVPHEYAYLGITSKALPWDQEITVGDFCNFYGGDIQGIINKINYLKSLGVEVIYLSPIFVSPSSHKYDVQDYDYVDPHFGIIIEDNGDALQFEKVHNKYATKYKSRTTSRANLEASNELFAKLVEHAHNNGIKVILDGVFNHCGSFNKWLDVAGFYKGDSDKVGAFHSHDSPYYNYFVWHDSDTKPPHGAGNHNYEGWWSNDNHPKLNFEDSKELFDYILEVGKKWVSPPYNADGWRLDVAADLGQSSDTNHKFWQKFSDAVKSANPNAIILAEHYGDPSPWLNGKEWDTIMNYDAFMEPISWFLTGVSKHSEERRPHLKGDAFAFEHSMRYHMSFLNVHALQMSMNQLSNHDHSRFLTRTNGNIGRWHTVGAKAADINTNKNVMMAAVTFQMTWPGSPTIYYGDEAGLTGWTDPDNRRPFPWGNEDIELTNLHKAFAKVRNAYPVLRQGSVEFLKLERNFLSYGRWDDHQKIVVAINSSDKTLNATIPVWKIGMQDGHLVTLIIAGNETFAQPMTTESVCNGEVKITLPAFSSVVLASENQHLGR